MTDGSHQLRPDLFFPLDSEAIVLLLTEKIKVVPRREDDPRLRVNCSPPFSCT